MAGKEGASIESNGDRRRSLSLGPWWLQLAVHGGGIGVALALIFVVWDLRREELAEGVISVNQIYASQRAIERALIDCRALEPGAAPLFNVP